MKFFFSLVLRVELLYKPFAADPHQGLAELNRLSMKLGEKTKKYTFKPMQALFLQQITAQRSPANLGEASEIIDAFQDSPKIPEDNAIEALSDTKLVPLLKALNATAIHSLRNSVVHKHAYRPTRDQVETALKEARSILFPLTSRLGLHDDVNWYMAHS